MSHSRTAVSLSFLMASGAALSAQIVRGTVVDPGGQPVTGARVVLAESYGEHLDKNGNLVGYANFAKTPVLGRTKTGTKGTFALDGARMWPGQKYTIWVHTETWADGRVARFDPPAAGERDLGTIQLRVAATLRGRVTSGQAPIANALVRCLPAHGTLAAPDREQGWTTRTDAKGGYELTNIPSGPLTIVATAPGRVSEPKQINTRNGNLGAVDLALRKCVAAVGTIRSTAGTPLAGATISMVSITRQSGRGGKGQIPTHFTTTDADGRFELHGVLPGVNTAVQANLDGFQPAFTQTVAKDAAFEVDLRLRPLPAAKLIVVDENDKRIFRIRTRILLEGATAPGSFVTPPYRDGHALVRGFTDAKYQIDVQAPGFAVKRSAKQRLRSGKIETFTIRLDRGGILAGTVVDAAGKPVAGAKVVGTSNPAVQSNPFFRMMGRPPAYEIEVRTDARGRYRVPLLRPATYHLTVTRKGFAEASAKASVETGKVTTVEPTQMTAGAALAGTASQEGKPAPGARITITSLATKKTYTATADPKGKFQLTAPLAPGRYQAIAMPAKAANPLLMMVAANKSKVTFEIKAGAKTHKLELKITK